MEVFRILRRIDPIMWVVALFILGVIAMVLGIVLSGKKEGYYYNLPFFAGNLNYVPADQMPTSAEMNGLSYDTPQKFSLSNRSGMEGAMRGNRVVADEAAEQGAAY